MTKKKTKKTSAPRERYCRLQPGCRVMIWSSPDLWTGVVRKITRSQADGLTYWVNEVRERWNADGEPIWKEGPGYPRFMLYHLGNGQEMERLLNDLEMDLEALREHFGYVSFLLGQISVLQEQDTPPRAPKTKRKPALLPAPAAAPASTPTTLH